MRNVSQNVKYPVSQLLGGCTGAQGDSPLNRDWAFPESASWKAVRYDCFHSSPPWEWVCGSLSLWEEVLLGFWLSKPGWSPTSNLVPTFNRRALQMCPMTPGHHTKVCSAVTSAPSLSPSTAAARSPRGPPGPSRTSAGPAGPWPPGGGQPQGLASCSGRWQERWYPRSPGTFLGKGEQGCVVCADSDHPATWKLSGPHPEWGQTRAFSPDGPAPSGMGKGCPRSHVLLQLAIAPSHTSPESQAVRGWPDKTPRRQCGQLGSEHRKVHDGLLLHRT